jgi:hypothetical protein
MTSTFLHKDQNVPPNEVEERDAPACPNCGQQMWLMRIDNELSDKGTKSKRHYECGHCGTKKISQTMSTLLTPPR